MSKTLTEKLWRAEPTPEHRFAWMFDWRFSASVLRTRATGIISLIPLLGYFVLYGEQFGSAFSEMEALAAVPGFLAPIMRVHLVYFGSVLVFCGWVLCFFCPDQARQFSDSWDYAERMIAQRNNGHAHAAYAFASGLQELTPEAFEQKYTEMFLYGQFAIVDIKTATHNFHPHNLKLFWSPGIKSNVTGLFAAFHASLVRKHRLVAIAANAFFVLGISLIALPAFETFVRVISSLLVDFSSTALNG